MCFGEGDPITYKELIPPETRTFRKGLYGYLDPKEGKALYEQQIPSYPGQLPGTQPPDPGQFAGLDMVMRMLGYGGYQWPGMPGSPGSGTDGGGGGGVGPGGQDEEEARRRQEERRRKRREGYKPGRPGRGPG